MKIEKMELNMNDVGVKCDSSWQIKKKRRLNFAKKMSFWPITQRSHFNISSKIFQIAHGEV